jgi:D-cysteine desulfhydrase
LNISLYFKRDDATGGVELGGNKVRKLEFLLADALAKECDAVVTIGGEQSNHCRATAAAR